MQTEGNLLRTDGTIFSGVNDKWDRFSTLFEDSDKDLFKKIADYPDRYIGIFRPTKPKTKLIQNITQSHEIRFGDALENIFGQYFELTNLIRHDRKIKYKDKDYDIDQLFSHKKTMFMIDDCV